MQKTDLAFYCTVCLSWRPKGVMGWQGDQDREWEAVCDDCY